MKINSLSLHNFGIYANTNTLSLSSSKPVILIGGMNGRGKTTVLEAILLALYGRRSFAFNESKLSFPNYLSSLVNKTDGSLKAYIELEFELSSSEEKDLYIVKREWSLHKAIPSLKTFVNKNGLYDQILSDNWDLFVEEMLPSAIAPFFFFDGEKISELATSDNEVHMKSFIKTLLGIDVIDRAIIDIQKIISNKKHSVKINTYAKEIAVYEEKLNKANTEAKNAKEEAGLLEIKQQQLSNKLQDAENEFATMGGYLFVNRKELSNKQSVLKEKLEAINSQIIEIVSGDLPLLMVLPLLQQVLSVSETEKEQKAIHTALEKLPALYKEFDKGRNRDLSFDEFIRFVKSNSKEVETVYDLTENGLFQLKTLCSTLPNHQSEEMVYLLNKRQDILHQLDEIESYLSINIDESAASKKHSKILKLTSELATVAEQYRLAQESASIKHAEFEELERQKLKVIENAVGNLEGEADIKKIVTYANYSINVLNAYKTRLQEAKTQNLADTMTKCFTQIVSKKNLISKIEIDSDSLDFIYLDSSGSPISRSILSAGEKQLLVIAMLWALGICSKKQLPVIIDTPLARLDSIHREALITNYFPKASDQTILLSTDSEVYGKYYDMIRPYVEKEFTLVYIDETKQTIVKKGYFGGNEK